MHRLRLSFQCGYRLGGQKPSKTQSLSHWPRNRVGLTQSSAFLTLTPLSNDWLQNDVRLSAEYRLPKMQYKGKEIRPHKVRVPREPMVQEIPEVC